MPDTQNTSKCLNEELELLEAIETCPPVSEPFDNNALKQMAAETLEYLNKKSKTGQPSKKHTL